MTKAGPVRVDIRNKHNLSTHLDRYVPSRMIKPQHSARNVRLDRHSSHALPDIATCRNQWPSGLRRGSAAAQLWVQIPPAEWTSDSYQCCVLSYSGPCIKLIARPECGVSSVCDNREPLYHYQQLVHGNGTCGNMVCRSNSVNMATR